MKRLYVVLRRKRQIFTRGNVCAVRFLPHLVVYNGLQQTAKLCQMFLSIIRKECFWNWCFNVFRESKLLSSQSTCQLILSFCEYFTFSDAKFCRKKLVHVSISAQTENQNTSQNELWVWNRFPGQPSMDILVRFWEDLAKILEKS